MQTELRNEVQQIASRTKNFVKSIDALTESANSPSIQAFKHKLNYIQGTSSLVYGMLACSVGNAEKIKKHLNHIASQLDDLDDQFSAFVCNNKKGEV